MRMTHELLPRALLVFSALLPFSARSPALGQASPGDLATRNGSPTGNSSWASVAGRPRAADAIEALRSQLRTADSATAVLDRWCASHRMAPPGAVVADKIPTAAGQTPTAPRRLLRIGSNEPVGFRHVRLRCGDHVLSDALLWYVPSRVTEAMNRQLRETNIPFGRVIAPLHFRRRSLAARRMWPPERIGAPSGEMPASLFYQTALLVLPDGAPVAYVREVYLRGVLDFPAP